MAQGTVAIRTAVKLDEAREQLVSAARDLDGKPSHHETLLAICEVDDAIEAVDR